MIERGIVSVTETMKPNMIRMYIPIMQYETVIERELA